MCRSWTLGHVRPGGQGRADGGRVQPGGRGLQEDPARVPDQPGACAHHQRDHDQGGDGVGPREPRRHDDQPGHRRGRERVQVGEDMLERAGHVEPVVVAPPARAIIMVAATLTATPSQRDGKDHPAVHRRRGDQVPDRRVAQPGRQQHQRDAVGLRGHDLRALEAVGVAAGRGPGGQPRGDQHERDGGGVRQHVRGVGDQGQGMGSQPGRDLPGHEEQNQGERSPQPPGVRIGHRAVRMPLSSRHHLTISSPGRGR